MADDHYSWKLSRRADRDLEQLPEGVAAAAVELIAGPIASNPYRLGGPLHDELEGFLSARLGTYYRVVYRVDEEARMVEVARIRLRGKVYKS